MPYAFSWKRHQILVLSFGTWSFSQHISDGGKFLNLTPGVGTLHNSWVSLLSHQEFLKKYKARPQGGGSTSRRGWNSMEKYGKMTILFDQQMEAP